MTHNYLMPRERSLTNLLVSLHADGAVGQKLISRNKIFLSFNLACISACTDGTHGHRLIPHSQPEGVPALRHLSSCRDTAGAQSIKRCLVVQ